MALSDEDIREILRIIDESDLDELDIQTEGFVLHVRRGGRGGTAPAAPEREREREPESEREPEPEPEPEPAADKPGDGLVAINSPMLGTFYRAAAPGAKPFIEPGSRVEPDTIVCIIEVMKMMNSIPAGVSGEVVEVAAENAELVEYGQTLFRVQPESGTQPEGTA